MCGCGCVGGGPCMLNKTRGRSQEQWCRCHVVVTGGGSRRTAGARRRERRRALLLGSTREGAHGAMGWAPLASRIMASASGPALGRRLAIPHSSGRDSTHPHSPVSNASRPTPHTPHTPRATPPPPPRPPRHPLAVSHPPLPQTPSPPPTPNPPPQELGQRHALSWVRHVHAAQEALPLGRLARSRPRPRALVLKLAKQRVQFGAVVGESARVVGVDSGGSNGGRWRLGAGMQGGSAYCPPPASCLRYRSMLSGRCASMMLRPAACMPPRSPRPWIPSTSTALEQTRTESMQRSTTGTHTYTRHLWIACPLSHVY